MIRLLLLVSSINYSFQRHLTVQEVTLNCQREVTSTIVCSLPSDAGANNLLEVTAVSTYIPRDEDNWDVKDAAEVNLSDKFMSINMPSGIGEQFKNLQALWLVRSKVQQVTKVNFQNMQQLKALNLYENQIQQIPSDAFQDLSSLEYLDLDNNHLVDLGADLLINQPELLVFRASFNKITSIPDGFFRMNEKIQRIHLNGNKIIRVMVDFTVFTDLIAVNLDGNENGCDFSAGFYENEFSEESTTAGSIDEMTTLQFKVEKFCRAQEDEKDY